MYAKEASKTVATIYGGYKVGKGVRSLTDNLNIVTKQVSIGSIVNADGTLSMSSVIVPSITNTAIINQALMEASVGNAMISTSGKNGGNKPDSFEKFDLNDPESFRGAKLEDVEKFLDKNLKDKTLGKGKKIFEKRSLKDGNGVRYYNESGQHFELNYGYDELKHGTRDGIHNAPYLKTTVGSKKIHIPLK